MACAEVDIVSDFVSDTVSGIADGVHGMLNFAPWHRCLSSLQNTC